MHAHALSSPTPLAEAAALIGDDTWAARVPGTRDTMTEQTGAPAVDKSVRELRERTEQEVRGRLGPECWATRRLWLLTVLLDWPELLRRN